MATGARLAGSTVPPWAGAATSDGGVVCIHGDLAMLGGWKAQGWATAVALSATGSARYSSISTRRFRPRPAGAGVVGHVVAGRLVGGADARRVHAGGHQVVTHSSRPLPGNAALGRRVAGAIGTPAQQDQRRRLGVFDQGGGDVGRDGDARAAEVEPHGEDAVGLDLLGWSAPALRPEAAGAPPGSPAWRRWFPQCGWTRWPGCACSAGRSCRPAARRPSAS
jgi:hypothetical protein